MPVAPTLVLFAKYPRPGKVKTRLTPELGETRAAQLHRRLARHVYDVLQASGTPVEVQYDLASLAEVEHWLGAQASFVQQAGGGLTERLVAACRPTPHIFFGADTPGLTPEIVQHAVDGLARHEVVIGPASDGGYYLIGMQRAMPELFLDMPWSTDRVLPETLARLKAMGIEPLVLPELADCDRPEDLNRWPWLREWAQA